MTRFLHEYIEYPNGERIDNGYWEIDGDFLVNRNGGRHYYTPSDDDEIIESTWKDIIRKSIFERDSDSYITGWIAPDGKFYGCDPMEHRELAECVFGCDEIELEEKGYCKIYENPVSLRIYRPDTPAFGYICKFLTREQQDVLEKRGLEVNNSNTD